MYLSLTLQNHCLVAKPHKVDCNGGEIHFIHIPNFLQVTLPINTVEWDYKRTDVKPDERTLNWYILDEVWSTYISGESNTGTGGKTVSVTNKVVRFAFHSPPLSPGQAQLSNSSWLLQRHVGCNAATDVTTNTCVIKSSSSPLARHAHLLVCFYLGRGNLPSGFKVRCPKMLPDSKNTCQLSGSRC